MAQSDAFQRFYDNAMMRVTGAIPDTMRPELFETLRDFMQHTNIFTIDVTIDAVAGVYDYEFELSASRRTNRLMNFYESSNQAKSWIWPAALVLPLTIRLGRAVSSPTTFVAVLSIYPIDPVDNDGNPEFPTWILNNYFDTIFSGMLWRMFSMPAKPWSNAALAATHYRMYKAGRGLALAEVQRGQSFNTQNWLFPGAGVVRGRQFGA